MKAVATLLFLTCGPAAAQAPETRLPAPFGTTAPLLAPATGPLLAGSPRSLAFKPQAAPSLISSVIPGNPRNGAGASLDQHQLGTLFDGSSSKGKKWWEGEWYGSFGWHRASFLPGDMRFRQPGLGNDFTLHGVAGKDHPDFQAIPTVNVTVPQQQWRLGHFIDEKRGLAVELAFDHVKFDVVDGQRVRMTGTLGGQPVDQPVELDSDVLSYRLNNGANIWLFNIVKRMPLVGRPGERFSLAMLAKAGVGFTTPHVSNTVFGQGAEPHKEFFGLRQENAQGFQFGGVAAGVEAGLRFVPFRPFFIDVSQKFSYAGYHNIEIYQGRADHDLFVSQTLLTAGLTVNLKDKKRR